jgi:hypothetical protein
MLLHGALLVAFPVALLDRGALVVQLLALGDADLELDPALFPVHGGGHQGVALAFDQADELVELVAVQQQFAGARRVRRDVGGGAQQRVDGAAEDEGLAILDGDIALLDVDVPGAQRLDLPSLQRDARLVALLDEVVMPGLLVQGNGIAGGSGLFFCAFHHGSEFYMICAHATAAIACTWSFNTG